jgi:hypothetical protein
MTKKIVRNRESYFKNWTAVITGSVLFVSSQAAAQAANEDRPNFRAFREANPGFDRHTVRQMFKQETGRGNGGVAGGVNPVDATLNIMPVPNVPQVQNAAGDNNLRGRWANRLERNGGVIKQTVQNNGNGNLVNLNGGVNLDLTSQARNITLGQKLFNGVSSIEIEVGGEKKTLSAGAQVTAAEYIAAKQILAGTAQKVTIASSGVATGGEVDLSAITARGDVMRASDLVVPVNVTTLGDFSKGSEFKLQGDLNNYGTVHALDSGDGGRGGTIRANDITNNANALISSDVDLTLRADGQLTNLGNITSNGNLTLSSSNITNSGNISSAKSVTLDSSSTTDLNVNNAGGTIAAAESINVRAADYAGTNATNLSGGNWLSSDLNLNAGGGTVTAAVGNVSGEVNSTGNAVHFSSASETLNIGDTNLIDPTFFNNGNINFTGSVTVAADLTVIATGNITESAVGAFTLNTNGGGTAINGGNLTLIAGANITSSTGTPDPTLPTANPGGQVTFNGGSIGGGSIQLGNVNMNTAGGAGLGGNGGNVLLAAFQGVNAGSGVVNLASGVTSTGSSINTSGDGAGANGNIDILGAGGIDLNAGGLGSINANGGTGGGGLVNISTRQPVTNGPVTYNADGSLASGSVSGAGTLSNAAVDINNVNAGALTVYSGGNLAINDVNTTFDINLNAGVFGATIVNPAASMTLDGNLTSQQVVVLTTANDLTQTNGTTINGALGVGVQVGNGNGAAPGGADFNQLGSITSGSNISIAVDDDYTQGNGAGDTLTAIGDVNISTGNVGGDGNFTQNAAITAGGTALQQGNVFIDAHGDYRANTASADINAGQGDPSYVTGVNISANDVSSAAGANITGRFVTLISNTVNGGSFDLDGAVVANDAGGGTASLTLVGANQADLTDASVSGGIVADQITLNNATAGGSIAIQNTGTNINFVNVTASADQNVTLIESQAGGRDGNINFTGLSDAVNGTFTVLVDHNITSNAGATVGGVNGSFTSNGAGGVGNIGVDANNRFTVDIDNAATFNALGGPSATAGNAFVEAVNNLGLNTSQVQGTFDIVAANNLTSNGTVTAGTLILNSTNGSIGANGSPFTVDSGAGGITANAANGSVYLLDFDNTVINGASGALNAFSVTSFGDLNVTQNISSADTTIASVFGDVTLGAGVTVNGTNTISLDAGDDIIANATSKVTGGALDVSFGDLGADTPVTLQTAVTSISSSTSAATANLTINEDDGINIGAQSVSTLNVNAGQVAAGDVNTTADFTVNVLNVTNDNGDILLSNAITANTSASFDTTTGGGDILQNTLGASISTPTLALNTSTGDIGSFFSPIIVNGIANGSTSVTAQSSGGGEVGLDYAGTGTITLGASAGNDDFTVLTSNGGSVAVGGNISGTGSFISGAQTFSFNGAFNVDFADVLLTSDTSLTVNGNNGTFTSDVGGAGVQFIAQDGSITTNGQTNFNGGDVFLTLANNDGINSVTNNGTLNGDNSLNELTIESRVVTLGTITNFAFVNVINGNTIINTSGDVTLPANLIFQGESLAIIASGNITATGAVLIDLSTATGNGGDLTILAGVTVTPASMGQEQSDQAFTITGFNSTGGNVALSGVDIVTTSGNSFGGDVLIYANGGTANVGTVAVGNITTTGALNGGNVAVGGEGGVTVGNINTIGTAEVDGDVAIGVGTVSISGPFVVTDGAVTSGTLVPLAITAGNLSTGTINAGSGDVALAGGFGAANTISTGAITGDTLEVLLVDGTATFANTTLNNFNANSTGLGNTAAVTLSNETGNLDINEITGAGLDVSITAGGALAVNGAIDLGTGTLALTSNQAGGSGITFNATVDADDVTLSAVGSEILINENITATNDVVLTAASVNQTDGTVAGATLDLAVTGSANLNTAVASVLASEVGDLVLTNTGALTVNAVTATGGIDITNTGGSVIIAGALDATTGLTVDSGDNLTVNAAVSSDVDVNLFADGDLAVNANVTATDGVLNLIADTGNLTTAANITIQGDDSIVIQAAGGGTVNIGTGNTIFTDAKTTGQGGIAILQGALPTRTKNLKGRNITVVEQDGSVLTGRGKGTKKVIFEAPENILTAQGADLLIKASAKNGVIINGGATITADPPVAAGTPITVTTWGNNSSTQDQNAPALPVTLASLTAPAAASASALSVNLMTTANATATNGRDTISTQLSNLATANNLSVFAGQEDDSTIVGYAPVGQVIDGKVCSDIEFGFAAAKAGSAVSTIKHSELVTLNSGSALFVPSKNMTVVTPKGSVKLGANSVAFVSVDENQLSVYDINDQHKGSVVVAAGGRDMSLSPGRHLIVTTDRAATFADANPIESIMHRSVTTHNLGAGKRAFSTEFSIPSAVQIVKPLSAMMLSENAAAKKVAQNVIKTSAVMMHLGGATPFEFHAKPKTVALQW